MLKKKITNIKNIFFTKVNKGTIVTNNDKTNKMLTSNLKCNKIRRNLKRQKNSKRSLQIKNAKKTMKFIDEELNTLPYNLAINYDKRNYCEFYGSLLKTQHNFISSFFYSDDYNSKIIKIDLFFSDLQLNIQ